MKDISIAQISAIEKIIAKASGRDYKPRVCFHQRISTNKWECEFRGISRKTCEIHEAHGLLRSEVVIPPQEKVRTLVKGKVLEASKFFNAYFKYELAISLGAAKCLIAGWAVGNQARLALTG